MTGAWAWAWAWAFQGTSVTGFAVTADGEILWICPL